MIDFQSMGFTYRYFKTGNYGFQPVWCVWAQVPGNAAAEYLIYTFTKEANPALRDNKWYCSKGTWQYFEESEKRGDKLLYTESEWAEKDSGQKRMSDW